MQTKRPRNVINGWINLNKPLGITSADAVNKAKWLLKPVKIGHAGTLDPLATGVLPLALGEGTKCVNLLMDAKKTYEFAVTFGERRSTDDAEGEVVATSGHIPTEAEIRAVLPQFTGPIMQLPPIYSALKVAGKRAYDMARAGEEVVLERRPVTIHSLELLSYGATSTVVPLPLRERLGEGAAKLRTHLPLAQEEQALDRAQALRKESTDAENILWMVLRSRQLGGFKFRRQYPVDQYIADFICLDERLIIELDGGQHTAAVEQDAKRTAYLEAQGFRVVRFWNNEVLGNREGVLEVILRYLTQRPLTQPSPARGEGFPAAPSGGDVSSNQSVIAHFRAKVSKGTYIRSLGRDIAQATGSEGYISRLHRAAVGPFTDAHAISLDFLEDSVHNAPPNEGFSSFITPLVRALDDIPELVIDGGQLNQLRHGQRVTLAEPTPAQPQIAVIHAGELVALARVEGNQLIPTRVLVLP